jgi:hypothetical protein
MAEQSNILDIVKTKLIQAATEATFAKGRVKLYEKILKSFLISWIILQSRQIITV